VPIPNPHLKSHKAQKIDLQQSYPCPSCHRQGKLNPIALTDAMGCDRCHLIFVVENEGYSLILLGGLDRYRRDWYWMGDRWQLNYGTDSKYSREIWRRGFILLFSLFLIMVLPLFGWLIATHRSLLLLIFLSIMSTILLLAASWGLFMSGDF